MKINNIRIGTRLRIGFFIVVMLTGVIGLFSYYQINNISKYSRLLYEDPMKVSNAVRDIKTDAIAMHRSVKDIALTDDSFELEMYVQEVDDYAADIKEKFELVRSKFLGEKSIIQEAEVAFKNWDNFRKETISIKKSGNSKLALLRTKAEGASVVEILMDKINVLIDYSNKIAAEYYENTQKEQDSILIWQLGTFVAASLIGLAIAFLITGSIIGPLKKTVDVIKQISEGKFGSEIDYDAEDELGALSKSIRIMQENLRAKAEIIQAVSVGDFSHEPVIYSNEDLVSVAIVKLIQYLREIVYQANLIAEGDFRSELELRSEQDELGIAINKMVDSLNEVVKHTDKVAQGDYDTRLKEKSEKDILARSLNEMSESLKKLYKKNDRQDWIKTGQTKLYEEMRGLSDINILCKTTISFITKYMGAQIGAFYILDKENNQLSMVSSYAFTYRKNFSGTLKIGEGLVGQAALEKEIISVTDIPDDYIRISSAFGSSQPKNLIVIPLLNEGELEGVIEIGAFKQFTLRHLDFLSSISTNIAIALSSVKSRKQLEILFEETEQKSRILKEQQEALKATNEELEEQTEKLKLSENELKLQREELQATNEELEEKTLSLEKQRQEIVSKNAILEETQKNLEKKAEELEISSKYKSEFLANMSHELRTPLNSLLILSQDLASNKNSNLDDDQVQSAEIINKAGNDLLHLINDILDLSKIEAGKMLLHIEDVRLKEIAGNIGRDFKHVAENKGLKLNIDFDEKLPVGIRSDSQKIYQVIRNFLSNAIKFTEKGEVTVKFRRTNEKDNLFRSKLDNSNSISISVTDEGIGIPEKSLNEIFEAFQQVDGSTSRKYGGTGLGLSISRELSKLLGGEIQVESTEGKGSTFTLFIPQEIGDPNSAGTESRTVSRNEITMPVFKEMPGNGKAVITPVPENIQKIEDDIRNLSEGDRTILVIEDDPAFAQVLKKFCHDKEFKFIHAADGITGLEYAKKYKPDGIILDIKLPGMEGWGVLEVLKDDTDTRHIPVHMMSADEQNIDAFRKGAIGYITKPVTKPDLEEAFKKIENFSDKELKNLLIVEDDENLRISIMKLIGDGDVKSYAVGNGKEAIKELHTGIYDCMILDLTLPDMTGFKILEEMDKSEEKNLPPVIIYTGKEITREEEYELQKYASSIIIKGVKSEERLLDETAMFLHRVVDKLPANKKKMIKMLHDKDALLENKKILIVDDDMRNVFAINKILQEKGMDVLKAPNGKKALELLQENPQTDLVLMDIMMPVMDGYETMQEIRKIEKFWKLPIIALTAKAMKEDREKCIEAGANDYMPKPVNIDRLLSLMRVWLYK